MMIYLVAVYFSACGFFSYGSDCPKAETVARFVTIGQCRETASAMRKVAKGRGQKIQYFCMDRGL